MWQIVLKQNVPLKKLLWRYVLWRNVMWQSILWRNVLWRNVLWRNVLWRNVFVTRYPVTNCPVRKCLCDEMSMWQNVLWHNVRVTKCQCDEISCDEMSLWQNVCDKISCDNMSCDKMSAAPVMKYAAVGFGRVNFVLIFAFFFPKLFWYSFVFFIQRCKSRGQKTSGELLDFVGLIFLEFETVDTLDFLYLLNLD